MSNIHVCLQVRSSSDRLPYKCLLPINKLESVKVLIKRVKSKKYSVNILTSNTKTDDYLCNILIDKNLITELISFYKKNNYNYVSINRKKSKLPYGISVELFNLKTLKKWRANNLYDKEHVTSKIRRKEKSQGYFIKHNNKNFYNLRCTLDNIEDYFVVKTIFEKAKSFKLNYLEMCKILNNIKKKEINNQKKIIQI